MAVLDLAQTISAIGEFQNTNRWLFKFTKIGGITMPDNILFRCESLTLPEQEFSNIETKLNTFDLVQPGTVKRRGAMDLSFVEGSDGAVSRLWNDITKEYVKITGGVNASPLSKGWLEIKGGAIAWLLDSQGNKKQQYTFQNTLLQPKFGGDLGSDDDVLKRTATLEYTYWFLENL